MPETRPPIELQGLSLADLQALIDQRRLPPRIDRRRPLPGGPAGLRLEPCDRGRNRGRLVSCRGLAGHG